MILREEPIVSSHRRSAVFAGLIAGLCLLPPAAGADVASDANRTRIELSTTEDYVVPATQLRAELAASAERDDPDRKSVV